jgi:hypothetical protein
MQLLKIYISKKINFVSSKQWRFHIMKIITKFAVT